MKKRIAILLALALLCCATLASCFVQTPPDGSEGGDGYSIVCADSTLGMQVRSAYFDAYGKMCSVYEDADGVEGKLILIGDTAHASSAYAKGVAEQRISVSSYDDAAGYAICEHQGNVAIWWSNDAMAQTAVTGFVDGYVKTKSLPMQTDARDVTVDSLYEFRHSLEVAAREAAFEKLEAGLGRGTVEALRALYALYDENLYIWMANLYDPSYGGYYYANSALATNGYLPDLESTKQILGFINDSGMLISADGTRTSLSEALPEEMKEAIVSRVHSMQSSYDGYYYHPQWPTVAESRSRDLNWGVQLLELFGEIPLYDTATGVKGSLGAPSASATSFVGRGHDSSIAAAVSCIVPAAYTSIYDSPEAFKEYFDSLPWGTDSYTAGGQLSGRSREIRSHGLAEYCVSLMDAEQEKIQEQLRAQGKEPNGLWETEVSYNAVNGIMKISSTYTVLGGKINYATEMIDAAMQMLLAGKDINGRTVENAVYVYNPWVAIKYCLNNLEDFGAEQELQASRRLVRDSAAELILATARDVERFKISDGSFSIITDTATDGAKKGSKYELYGLPHSVAGVVEGDVNGATLISSGLVREICAALDVREFQSYATIPMFYETDMEAYLEITSGLQAIIKPEIELSFDCDFEDENLGASGTDIASLFNAQIFSAGDVTVTRDPAEGGEHGQVLRFIKLPYASKGDKFAVAASRSANTYCYVLEWDMLIGEVTPAEGKTAVTLLQVKLGGCYCLVVEWNNGKLRLADMDANVTVPLNINTTMSEWHNFRIEYYPSDNTYIKIYLDDEYVGASNNYVGRAEGARASTEFGNVEFFGLRAANFVAYFDNISTEKLAQDPTVEEDIPVFLPRNEFDFEGEELGAVNGDILCLGSQKMRAGELTVVDDPIYGQNLVMKYFTAPSDEGGDNLAFNAPVSTNDDCFVLEWDMLIGDVDTSAMSSASMSMMQVKLSSCYCLMLIYEDGKVYLADIATSAEVPERFGVSVDLGEWYNFRIEYRADGEEAEITVYIDGEAVYVSEKFYLDDRGEGSAPMTEFSSATFFALKRASFTAYLDNVVVEKLAESAE